MRTKALFCAAALAAGAATSMAQSNVYSLNVVGYVNYSFSSGNYVLVCNPLNAGTNDLNTILAGAPTGTQVQTWNTAAQDFDAATPVKLANGTWNPNLTVKPGQGFFVVANGNFTNTFVGEVIQGSVTNALVGGGNYEAIGSTVPVGGSITNVLDQYPALSGDQIQIWDVTAQDFAATTPVYSTVTGKWNPDVSFKVAEAFFLVRNGAAVNYVRTFTVQ